MNNNANNNKLPGLTSQTTSHNGLPEPPRELGDRLEAAAANRGWAEALDLKDEMLWELAERLKAGEAKLASEKELTDEYAKEIAHWVELCRELQAELDGARGVSDRDDRLRRDHKRLLAESGLVADELKDARATIAVGASVWSARYPKATGVTTNPTSPHVRKSAT